MISRRSFLKAVSASVALTTASRRLLSWADEAVEVPGKEGLIVRSARFLDLEMPPEFFDSWITPVPHFFVRNHMHEPNTLGPSEWRLTIGGEVEKPQTLNLTDLAKIEPHCHQYARVCRQRPRFPSAPCSRCSMAAWGSGDGTIHRPAPARFTAACRCEEHRQARDVSGSRRGARESPPVHSQHSHRKGDGLRHSHSHSYERSAAHQASRISGARSGAGMDRPGFVQVVDRGQGARQR